MSLSEEKPLASRQSRHRTSRVRPTDDEHGRLCWSSTITATAACLNPAVQRSYERSQFWNGNIKTVREHSLHRHLSLVSVHHIILSISLQTDCSILHLNPNHLLNYWETSGCEKWLEEPVPLCADFFHDARVTCFWPSFCKCKNEECSANTAFFCPKKKSNVSYWTFRFCLWWLERKGSTRWFKPRSGTFLAVKERINGKFLNRSACLLPLFFF